jgi:6-pyruvoyltetrahydropterin/6-carboxytetrahydropterin synthase
VITVTTSVSFSAAHDYRREEWSDDKNRAVFGLCANPEGHGHNYRVLVTVSGPVDLETGMVINFDQLHPLLISCVTAELDHVYLNRQIPFFASRIPTLENVALYLWQRLSPEIAALGVTLTRIRVYEHDDLFVDYDGFLGETAAA